MLGLRPPGIASRRCVAGAACLSLVLRAARAGDRCWGSTWTVDASSWQSPQGEGEALGQGLKLNGHSYAWGRGRGTVVSATRTIGSYVTRTEP